MTLGAAVPALPTADLARSLSCYRERLGFAVLHAEDTFAVVRRDDCELHLWLADDLLWRDRSSLAERPVRSGAESFLAGTASCRIAVGDEAELQALHAELSAVHVLHAVSGRGVTTTAFGDRELHAIDPDGNLLSFYWRPAVGS